MRHNLSCGLNVVCSLNNARTLILSLPVNSLRIPLLIVSFSLDSCKAANLIPLIQASSGVAPLL